MEFLRLEEGGLQWVPSFLTSVAIGLLIGLERERSPAARAGLRTFTLVALFGTLAALLGDLLDSPWLVIAGLLAVGLLIVAAYTTNPGAGDDPGTTTQAALLVCYGLGVLVWFQLTALAIMLAIGTTVLLYFKAELHGITKRLQRRDLLSILQFAVLTFVILPVLPNESFGPYGALNPYHIWLMVVLIAGVSLAGYLSLRIVGQRYGAPLLGIFGGLVSSTATTMVYAKYGRAGDDQNYMAATIILLANLVVTVRLSLLAAIVAPSTFGALATVLGSAFLLGAVVTALYWNKLTLARNIPIPDVKNPTELKIAFGFGAIYAVVLLLTAWLSDMAGTGGLFAIAFISGLTDVDAMTLSALHLFSLDRIGLVLVVGAVTTALVANMIFKFAVIFFVGGRHFALLCLPGFVAITAGAGSAVFFL